MLDPLIKSIEVPCSQKEAFGVFVNEMDSWWPLAKFTISAMGGAPAKALRVDPRVGGTVVEIGPDGSEHLWGTFLSYDPYDAVSMDFHITQPGVPRGPGSLVEVQFIPLDKARTRVVLTQSNWEALGEHAEALRGGYGGGWVLIFEQAFKAACGG